MKMKSIKLNAQCPYCGKKFDIAAPAFGDDDRDKVDYDIAFCIKCGKVGLFKGNKIERVDEFELPPYAYSEVQIIRQHWEKVIKEEQYEKRRKNF